MLKKLNVGNKDTLIEYEKNLLTLLDNLPGMVYRCRNDEHWTMKFVSEGCLELTGYHSQELINNVINYNDLIYDQDRERVSNFIQNALKKNNSYQLEYRIITRNGEEKWVWEKGRGVHSEQGELLYLEGFITDINEYHRIENEVRLLQSLTQSISHSNNFNQALEISLKQITEAINWDFAEAWFLDKKNSLELSNSCYIKPEKKQVLQKFSDQTHKYVLKSDFVDSIQEKKRPQWIENILTAPNFKRKNLASEVGINSCFGVPVIAEDEVFAVLVFFKDKITPINQHLLDLVFTITLQLSDLLSRKKIEVELEENQRILGNLIDTIPGIFFSVKNAPNLPFLYVSKGCENILGYNSSELINNNLFNFINQEDLKIILPIIKKAIAKKKNYRIEYRIKNKNGEEKWLWEKGHCVLDSQGKVINIDGFISDITERKNIENALKLAEENYRNIFENALEGIFQTTFDGQYINANPALARIYGYDSPEDLMATISDIKSQLYVQPEKRNEFITLLDKNGYISDFQSEVYKKDRSIIWTSTNARVVKNSEGKILYYEGTVEDITVAKQTEKNLHLKAFYDELTGLVNRSFFMEKLETAIQKNLDHNYQFAVLFLDLDRFKLVNDSLGHLMGDRLLIGIAKRLDHCLRGQDTVARLGGDEFTILLENVKDINNVILVADRILNQLKKPFQLEKHEIFSGSSIGIFFSKILDSILLRKNEKNVTAEEILSYADSALYRAKEMGKGCYQIFDETMQSNALAKLQLETELRYAIKEHEFDIYYQPIINLSTNKIVSFEAFLRWNHPEKGVIPPQEFLELAEENGLIIPLGHWMLQLACKQLKHWQNTFNNPALMININLTKKQFDQPNLLTEITDILRKNNLQGYHLNLEISESCWLQNIDSAKNKLQALRNREIKLCVDDFGTGYSCLNYLYQFPLNTLKIDPDFVRQIEQENGKFQVAKAIFMLANNLGLEAIATGIETKEQLTKIRELNCNLGQGYLFSPPLKSDDIESLIINN